MDQIWWNHIIKAHAFLENVVKSCRRHNTADPSDSVPMEKYISGSDREQLLMEAEKINWKS